MIVMLVNLLSSQTALTLNPIDAPNGQSQVFTKLGFRPAFLNISWSCVQYRMVQHPLNCFKMSENSAKCKQDPPSLFDYNTILVKQRQENFCKSRNTEEMLGDMEYIRLAPCKGTCYVFQGRNQAPCWSIKHDIEKEPGTDAHLVDKSLEQQH